MNPIFGVTCAREFVGTTLCGVLNAYGFAVRYMVAGLVCSVRLLPIPVLLLCLTECALLQKQLEVDRLVGSLQIDSRHTRELLDWSPPVSVAEGIRQLVQGS